MKEDIGSRLRLLRQILNLTQADFGKKLGVSLRTIQRYEKGEVKIPEGVLRLIEQIFSVNPLWLRKGEGEIFVKEPKEKVNIKVPASVFTLIAVSLIADLKKEGIEIHNYESLINDIAEDFESHYKNLKNLLVNLMTYKK